MFYAFTGNPSDGAGPDGLIEGGDGNFYVTAGSGGQSNSGGIVKITPTGTGTLLYSFDSSPEGARPVGLIQGNDGNFYVTTDGGGPRGAGTFTKITAAGQESAIAGFNGGSEGWSLLGLIQGSDGNFYGTTYRGGASDKGTVFKVTPAGVETVIHSFTGGNDGSEPTAALVQGSDGNLYGTTTGDDPNPTNGTVFKVTQSGIYNVLYSFSGGTADGAMPRVALIQGSDGNLYGTTGSGGAAGNGTFFKITPAGVETVIHSFASTGEGSVNAPLIQGNDRNFYGITASAGPSKNGTIFKITPDGVETEIYSFSGDPADGSVPNSLILGADGYFYGTTYSGGAGGGGTMFKF